MPSFSPNDFREAVRRLGFKCRYPYAHMDSALFTCCFHKDNSPSMGFNFIKGQYHCFQCGRSGTINNLSKELTGKYLKQLLDKVDDLDSLNIQQEYNNDSNRYVRKTVHPVDIRGNMIPYYNSERALGYLERRGISVEVATAMDMRYATEIYINGSYFEDRLLIPVYNKKGDIVNVEGRAIEKTAEKKCLYPYRTIKPLYEWYKLDTLNPLFLFEGIIKMAVARTDSFFANSSATLGSQISEYQLIQLNNFHNVVLVRDSDDAGIIMAQKVKKFYNGNLQVWTLADSKIKDVDEIPTTLGITVKEYREKEGFLLDISFY